MSETYDLYQQGRAHLRKGRAAQATVALEKAKRREPDKASIREALGIAYLRIQRYEEAEQEFRKMLELSPADHYAHYALGRALEKQGRQAAAVRAVCQRVSEARVRVNGAITAEIGNGLVVLLGIARGDGAAEVERLAGKVARLRVFGDAQGRFDRSLLDVGGAALVVSQFT